jgi:hypothetical protein
VIVFIIAVIVVVLIDTLAWMASKSWRQLSPPHAWSVWYGLVLSLQVLAILVIYTFNTRLVVPTPSSEVASVEQALSKHLPDPALLEERHQQLLEALKSDSSSAPHGYARSRWLWLGLIAMLFLAAAAIRWGASPLVRNLAAGVFVFLGTGVAIDHFLKLGLCEKLFGELIAIHFEGGQSSGTTDLRLTVDLGDSAVNLECPSDHRVGPFADAKSDQLESGSLEGKADRIVEALNGRCGQGRLVALLFVGSADKRELGAAAAEIFGSNAGLAQARAVFLEQLIRKRLVTPHPTMLSLSRGPGISISTRHSSPPQTSRVLSGDRHVQVCEIWGSRN